MNTYGIIGIVSSVIFVAVMAWVFYSMNRPTCGSNQEYIDCDGSGKKCYPKCSDSETLYCDIGVCGPTCTDDQQLYGPLTTPSCSGEYVCGPVCDASSGEVYDCDSGECTAACLSPDVSHQCGDTVQCGEECSDNFTWDCTTQSCQPPSGDMYFCNKTADAFAEIDTESCDTSDPCCYQNINLAGACFNTKDVYWLGTGLDDSGNLTGVDMFMQLFDSTDTVVPYQGDTEYLNAITHCSDQTDSSISKKKKKSKDTPRKTLKRLRKQTTQIPTGSPEYKWWGQNYSDKYLRITAQYGYHCGYSKGISKQGVLEPNTEPTENIELWKHGNKDNFFICGIEIADTADSEWVPWYTNVIKGGFVGGDSPDITFTEGQKIVFQPIDCTDLSTLNTAQICS